jgi:hypothetical protein
MTHTPGPWHVAENPDLNVVDANGNRICCVNYFANHFANRTDYDDRDWADARLLAVAPELLAAGIEARDWLERHVPDYQHVPAYSQLCLAIERAKHGGRLV